MPNPWDIGSARLLASMGFPALATTSLGHAASLGKIDQSVTRDELLHLVWGYSDAPLTRTVDNFIFRLRHKLEPDPRHPTYIRKAYGDGYRLITE